MTQIQNKCRGKECYKITETRDRCVGIKVYNDHNGVYSNYNIIIHIFFKLYINLDDLPQEDTLI